MISTKSRIRNDVAQCRNITAQRKASHLPTNTPTAFILPPPSHVRLLFFLSLLTSLLIPIQFIY